MPESTKAKIGVLGASGYTGCGAGAAPAAPSGRRDRAADRRPAGRARRCATSFRNSRPFALPKLVSIESLDWAGTALDLIFCALPHGTTQKVIKEVLAKARGVKVVDLSADFRLADLDAYARWYGHAHQAPELQQEAVYGLVEVYREAIKAARLVANPGCYTTCAQLALIPLIKAKAIDADEIVIDAKSGMTGAGRAAKEEMLFSEVSEGIHAYGVGHHRHMAELDQEFTQNSRSGRAAQNLQAALLVGPYGVGSDLAERPADTALAHARDHRTLVLQQNIADIPAAIDGADHVRFRHPHIVEEGFAERRPAGDQQDGLGRDALRGHVEQNKADAVMLLAEPSVRTRQKIQSA